MVSYKLNFLLYERITFEVTEFTWQKTTEDGNKISKITSNRNKITSEYNYKYKNLQIYIITNRFHCMKAVVHDKNTAV